MAQYVMKPQVNVKCALNKCFGELRILSGNKDYITLTADVMTLDNIFKNASDEELEAIVHSIIGRTWEQWKKSGINPNLLKPTDKELHEVAKGLRKPQ